jgi:hypothetical protein
MLHLPGVSNHAGFLDLIACLVISKVDYSNRSTEGDANHGIAIDLSSAGQCQIHQKYHKVNTQGNTALGGLEP